MQISVEVSSVIRASPDSFRVAWIERRYESGQLAATEPLDRHSHHRRSQTPRDADRLRKNPLGVFVNAINWSTGARINDDWLSATDRAAPRPRHPRSSTVG